MKRHSEILYIFFAAMLPFFAWADNGMQSFYCPQNHGYIKIGMTTAQVVAACGEPASAQDPNTPVMQKIPSTQLIYNNEGGPRASYGDWSLPIGNSNTVNNFQYKGNAGSALLQVNIVDNKVHSISLNGSGTNAFSICDGTSIEINDPIAKVYASCGTPSLINKSYILKPIPSNQKPQVWIYQLGPYQPTVTLTFVNGRLFSIN